MRHVVDERGAHACARLSISARKLPADLVILDDVGLQVDVVARAPIASNMALKVAGPPAAG
jgi:hypothetical protein